jgi:outer membrane lipoprotein-sorting protein
MPTATATTTNEKRKQTETDYRLKISEYTLKLTKTENTAETIIPYDGKVYCIEMPTTNTYFFREHIFAADDVWK